MAIKIEVASNGAASIEAGTRVLAMSRFSYTAQTLADELGTGTHVLPDTFTDEWPAHAWDAVAAALAH